ncbi:MAG: hypothetical protein JJT85_11360 [Chromatiales bacterium]|nr:hypothetical protein [Chromatiales bacterium]
MSTKLRLAAAGSALALFSASSMAATVPDVTSEEALSHLAAEDLELLQEAVVEALTDPRNSVTVRWRNEASGNAGRAQVVGTFRARDARSCKVLRIVAPEADSLSYTVCRDDSGNWLEASDVRAPRMRG